MQNSVLLFKARGRSMLPFIKPHDIVLVEKIKPEKLKVHDLVCFKAPNNQSYILHRLIYKPNCNEKYFFTSSDRLFSIDEPFTKDKIVGKAKNIIRNNKTKEIYGKNKILSFFLFLALMRQIVNFVLYCKRYAKNFTLRKIRRKRIEEMRIPFSSLQKDFNNLIKLYKIILTKEIIKVW